MSVWQYMAAVDGFVQANSPDDGRMSASEADDLWDWMQKKGYA
jgi:hypothetical protein